jgi:flagellar FliJ protein
MKKFVFTLQRLFDVKKISEDQLLIQQDQINKRLSELQDKKDRMIRRFHEEKESYEADCRRGIPAGGLQSYGEYFDFLMQRVKEQDVLIRECLQEKERLTGLLLKLMNEMKVLEKIKKEQFVEYNKEMQKNDDKMLEDFLCGRM